MGRHSKQSATREFFTAGERAKAAAEYGTLKQRLGSDSQRRFDECQLCTSRLRDPVATPYGSLYCRECILANLLTQRAALEEQRRAYEDSVASKAATETARLAAVEEEALTAFARHETGVKASDAAALRPAGLVPPPLSSAAPLPSPTGEARSSSALSSASVSGPGRPTHAGAPSGSGGGGSGPSAALSVAGPAASTSAPSSSTGKLRIDGRDRGEKLEEVKRTAFWVPQSEGGTGAGSRSSSSSSSAAAAGAPDPAPRDPATGGFLRAKQLIPLKLAHVPRALHHDAASSASASAGDAAGAGDDADTTSSADGPRFQCPGCTKPIIYQATYVLRGCGHVVCGTCLAALVAPGKRCLTCSAPAQTKADIVKLQQGGSSFVGNAGTQTEASKYTPTVF